LPTEQRAAATPMTRDDLTRSGVVVLIGCAVCQMGLGFSYVFTTFLKPIVADFGWTRTAVSGVVGPLLLSMSLASPLIGALTDRLGARVVLSLSTVLLTAALFLFSQMTHLWHFYAISILLGLALTGLGDIPVGSIASRWFSGGRGLALGVVYVGSNVGGFAVPIAATAIAATYSWRGDSKSGRRRRRPERRSSRDPASTSPTRCARAASGCSPRPCSVSTSTTSACSIT
jgi:MFS family permease